MGCKHEAAAPAANATPSSSTSTAAKPADMSVVRMDPTLDKVIAPGTPIERVATGFMFNEGPMWHDGRMWFSDLIGNTMYAVSPDGKVEALIKNAGGMSAPPDPKMFRGSNAMVTDKDGTVLMCQHALRRIARLDKDLHQTTFIDKWEGKRLSSPNDLVFAPDGSLWFTDPPFGLDKKNDDPSKETPFNGVYRYDHGKLTAVIKDLSLPNGIGFSPDGKILYVSNSGPKMFVRRYDVKPDGTVANPSVLISYPDTTVPDVPDGLKVDSQGNVWTTGPGGIRIISPEGKVLGQIHLPEVAANLGWSGDGHTLYITASTSIYRLHTDTPGEIPLYTR
jgi:gluconolactonase